MAEGRKPQIDQIKIKELTYDINVPKSWKQNDPEDVGYIKDRTHYRERLMGTKISEAASHTFKNSYYQSGERYYLDIWQPRQSWVYGAKPCTCTTVTTHLCNQDCSGRYYKAKLQSGELVLFEGTIELIANEPGAKKEAIITFKDIEQYLQKDTQTAGIVQTDEIQEWANFKVWYTPTCAFNIEDEPHTGETSAQCTLTLTPDDYKFYNVTHRLDADFLPLDYKTITKDAEGNLVVDDTFTMDLSVTEQFGHYAPNSLVPAKGKSVKDVINDAFCKDIQPTFTNPFIECVTTGDGYYEVGTTVNLGWELRLNRGAYSYGVKGTDKTVPSPASGNISSNLFATAATIKLENSEGFKVEESTDIKTVIEIPYEISSDNCFDYKEAENYKILTKESKKIILSQPTTGIKLTASAVTKCDTNYTSVTMKGELSSPTVAFCAEDDTITLTDQSLPTLLTCDYRWFWGTNQTVPGNTSVTLPSAREHFNEAQSLLGRFPEQITTNKAQSFFFAAPAGQVKSLNVRNLRTNASVGIINGPDETTEPIKIKDASGINEVEYDLFYVLNDAADAGTQTYEIQYTLDTGGTT